MSHSREISCILRRLSGIRARWKDKNAIKNRIESCGRILEDEKRAVTHTSTLKVIYLAPWSLRAPSVALAVSD